MRLKNVQVTIKVEDDALQELDVDSQDNSAECYIPSEEGAKFFVHIQNPTVNDLEYRVFLNGISAQAYVVRADRNSSMKGTHVNQETLRPFVFARLKLTDDDAALMPSQDDLEALGTIRVDIYRVVWRGIIENPFHKGGLGQLDGDHAVHEKAKKAGSHRVKLGDPIQFRTSTIDVDYIDLSRGDPYLRFTFRYRPKGVLQAQGIMPAPSTSRKRLRSTSPEAGSSTQRQRRADRNSPSSDDEVIEIKDEGELNRMMAERAALDARIRAAKKGKVKREASPIVLGPTNGEVIDLTGD